MRASPAFQVTVRRYGVWRAAVLAVLLLTTGALSAWLLSPQQSLPWSARWAVVAVALATLAGAAPLLHCPARSLRWDSVHWLLGPAAAVGEEPWPGRLAVALDLGGWLLLRFEHDRAAGEGRRVTWLPVQRRGLEAQWHALRCAVYCARPVDGHAGSPSAAISPESQE